MKRAKRGQPEAQYANEGFRVGRGHVDDKVRWLNAAYTTS